MAKQSKKIVIQGEEIIIRRNVSKLLWMLLLVLGLAAGFIRAIIFVVVESAPIWQIQAYVFVILTALVTPVLLVTGVWFAVMLFRREPPIRISQEGITDRSTAVSPGLIYWSELEGMVTAQMANGSAAPIQMVMLVLNRPEHTLERLSRLRAAHFMSNLKRYGAPVLISMAMTHCQAQEVLDVITAYVNKNRIPV